MTMPQYGNCPHKPGTWCIPCVVKAHDEWDAERKRSEAEIAALNAKLAAAEARIGRLQRECLAWRMNYDRYGTQSVSEQMERKARLSEAKGHCDAHNDLTPPAAEGAAQ